MFIERMAGQDYIDKTREYLDYLEEHLENVRRAFQMISEACKGMWWVSDDYQWHMFRSEVEWHDISKFSQAEFIPYVSQFFPTDHEPMEWPENGFDKAWEHHKKNNHHHHETVKTYMDVVHMVIDWTAMGYKFNDTAEKYYEKNKEKIKLSKEHKKFLNEIFERLKAVRHLAR